MKAVSVGSSLSMLEVCTRPNMSFILTALSVFLCLMCCDLVCVCACVCVFLSSFICVFLFWGIVYPLLHCGVSSSPCR